MHKQHQWPGPVAFLNIVELQALDGDVAVLAHLVEALGGRGASPGPEEALGGLAELREQQVGHHHARVQQGLAVDVEGRQDHERQRLRHGCSADCLGCAVTTAPPPVGLNKQP